MHAIIHPKLRGYSREDCRPAFSVAHVYKSILGCCVIFIRQNEGPGGVVYQIILGTSKTTTTVPPPCPQTSQNKLYHVFSFHKE